MELDFSCTVEGRTRLAVPAGSLEGTVPPRGPAFFNPRAKRTRDLAVVACGAHMEGFGGPRTYLDAMAGTGARGLRVARELDCIDRVFINDANPRGVELARRGAAMNGLDNVEFSGDEACRFLSTHSSRGPRGGVTDVDPFGSPAPYMECAVRATAHGGMMALTATDLQVLGGLHDAACLRVYGGVPLRTVYGAETAVRLILGCAASVAGRLGKGVAPLYAESHMHYYRVYAEVRPRPGARAVGYILHCTECGGRRASPDAGPRCHACGGAVGAAGPLWTGRLFDGAFVERMARVDRSLFGGAHGAMLEKCRLEAPLPPAFYTLDEVASLLRTGPPRLDDMMRGLRSAGFAASPTAFSPTGFRTDADADGVYAAMASVKSEANQV